jgi:hypothetical protein
MHVFCTHCGTQIPADDLNIDTGLARCRACHAIFSFAAALDQQTPAASPHSARRMPATAAPPKGVQVEDFGGSLRMTRSWWHPAILFLLFFTIAWDAFLIFWYSIAFTQDNVPWIMIVFPVAHLAVGVGLTYFVLCSFVNRTVIEVGQGTLKITHGPLPWYGNLALITADIDQLYCKRSFNRSSDGDTSTSFELYVLDKMGSRHKLLSGLPDEEAAFYFERRIEDFLRITDRPVPGEYRG